MSDLKEKLNDNLTHILTGISMVAAGGTLVTGVIAGYQIKEDLDALDEDASTWEKVETVATHLLMPTSLAAISIGTAYAADKENTARIAALAGTVAVTQSENKYLKTFKEKAEEKLGKKKTEEVKDETEAVVNNRPTMGAMTRWMDLEFGFEFWTTKAEFDNAVETYNEEFNSLSVELQEEGLPISRFYEILLKDKFKGISKLDDYGLKYDRTISFRPYGRNLQGRVLEDGTLGWQFEYEISDLRVPILEVG